MEDKDVKVKPVDVKPVEENKTAPVLKTPQKVKIRLTGNHTHEEIKYEAGEFIEVDEASADYIINTAKTGVKV